MKLAKRFNAEETAVSQAKAISELKKQQDEFDRRLARLEKEKGVYLADRQ